jgi:two-component system chemotaxis sensor kinase CheA
MSDPDDPMAEIRASFFIECEELLEALQDGLQDMDGGDADPETINVVFRAVHSIKGGAGAFGLETLVRFAHSYESTLDEVRGGTLEVTPDVMRVFFQAADHLTDLVQSSRDGGETAEATELLESLKALLGDGGEDDAAEAAPDFAPMGLSLDLDLGGEPATPTFQITFKPTAELFGSGSEVLPLFKLINDLGEAVFTCDTSGLPPLDSLNVDTPTLSWTITVTGDTTKADIEEIFEFVDGLCELTIEEPAAEPPDLPALPEPETAEPPAEPEAPPETEPETPAADLPVPPVPASAPAATADAKPPKQSEAKPAATATKATVRVDLDRIDRLVNQVGELVINQAMLAQSVAEAGAATHPHVQNGLEEFQRLTRDIQDSVMMIRAQPVKSLFQRMSRIVREASSAVGKTVRLRTDGEGTEVDKTVIERLADPLTHMIRNAVDHGLESSEDRIAAGKSKEGIITLTAAHRSGRVIIEVADDGGGINRPKVFQIAVDKGLIPADSELSDSEIDNLLFLPGFSTASEVSDLSGRGVGMDVVRSSIQALGGRILISSEKGKGTTFSISLPLTLAVLDGMLVTVADQTLVVPLGLISETVLLSDEDIRPLGTKGRVVHLRDQFIPLLDLGVSLGYRSALTSYVNTIVLLITHEDGKQAALVVDAIEEQRQVVIKGLEKSYGRIPGVAAATILGDGRIALILDPVDIISETIGRSKQVDPELSMTG